MRALIQFVQMAHSESMEKYTEQKLEKLFQKYDWIIKADVFFKKENDSNDKGKICTIELSVPGPKIFAISNETNYELAVKETLKDLEVQLKKRKASLKPHLS